MPIYEYRCKKCSAEFEQVRSLAEMDRRRACPECGSRATERRLTSRFAFAGADLGSGPTTAGTTVAEEYERVQQAEDADAMTTADFCNDP